MKFATKPTAMGEVDLLSAIWPWTGCTGGGGWGEGQASAVVSLPPRLCQHEISQRTEHTETQAWGGRGHVKVVQDQNYVFLIEELVARLPRSHCPLTDGLCYISHREGAGLEHGKGPMLLPFARH